MTASKCRAPRHGTEDMIRCDGNEGAIQDANVLADQADELLVVLKVKRVQEPNVFVEEVDQDMATLVDGIIHTEPAHRVVVIRYAVLPVVQIV